jgi:hypothetical protein
MNNIKIGADPELFLEKNGEIISAEGLLGGTKKSPRQISDQGHAVQEDNIMVEFNIPAVSTCQDFKKELNFVLDYLKTFAAIHESILSTASSAIVNKVYLRTPQARTFGCEPDFNVYTRMHNPSVNAKTQLRTCGGHIHIGYDNPNRDMSERIIQAMDMVLGLESLELDKDDRRREMYGKAGSFRFKSYGVEYRTLSNFWVMSDDLIEWAFNKTMKALQLAQSDQFEDIANLCSEATKRAIDTNDKDLAKRIIAKIEQQQLTTV